MKVRELVTDAATGEVTERWLDLPDVLTEAEAIERERVETRRAEILATLAANDLKSLRPLREGDDARLAVIEAEQEALRAELAKLDATN